MKQIQRPGNFYHVILRGSSTCTHIEHAAFSRSLQKWKMQFGHHIHGFCFMSSHAHLIVQVGSISLIRSLSPLSFCYNHGTGRFRAILIKNKKYLFELIRYVHLNPVHAGIVLSPEQYKWSSHRAYLGLELIPWLTCELILQEFTRPGLDKTARFEHFINGLFESRAISGPFWMQSAQLRARSYRSEDRPQPQAQGF